MIGLMVGGVIGYSREASAQFLKNLVNNIVDSAVKHRVTNGSGGMTLADSPAAKEVLKGFMTASGGSGMFYQYQTRYDITIKGKDTAMVNAMSTSIADNGNTHVEMGMMGKKMNLIGRAGQPGYSVSLYPETRKYHLNIIDTARLNSGNGQTYQVTKIGTETVGGYPCIHSKMIIMGQNKKEVITEDIWTSASVPGYAQLKRDLSNQHVTVKMMQELEKAGCNGFIVKVTGGTAQMKFEMLLITVERKNFPASMFSIPTGYVEM